MFSQSAKGEISRELILRLRISKNIVNKNMQLQIPYRFDLTVQGETFSLSDPRRGNSLNLLYTDD